ncbi:hemin ABC transporter substrate-binding protein [Limnobaculum zhutongyuii]|uniref:Hemin ABC transporter substrate-binding protein n=1 Tax=Limnobaculum zhutongyuii TaxID=2498113 RepID=A0A411WH61_9GAMM|nr:ABC transporter substrate-binding protein [Limnobaculum zhutongyuii]QBH95549.1 hemin ABC transporter substrate-binding protein [Limnobaculum zhutongyuii]TQS88760.1 hemin ABC transporter substrate-binding protein [Limnobaculum zhutongyuii]
MMIIKRLITAVFALFLCGQVAAEQRLVVAGGSLSELVYAIGAGSEVVGVDQTTFYPPETRQLPQIGYWKELNVEGILSLRPDTFITWSDAGPKLVLEQLTHHKVKVINLPRTPTTIERMYQNIRMLSGELKRTQQGEALINGIQSRLEAVAKSNAQQKQPVRVMFLLSVGSNSPQVAGAGSVAEAVLKLAGGTNVATHEQYKAYSGEAIVAANPEVIVVTSQSMASDVQKKKLGNVAGIAHTAAWKNQRIIEVDQSLILGMGPRIVEAVEQLHQQLYPNNP